MKKMTYEKALLEELDQFAPDVLQKIKQSDQFCVPKKEKKQIFPQISLKRLSYTFASLAILFVLVFTIATQSNTVPVVASTVTIDINPSILIELDEDDYVINISAINNDGDLLIDNAIEYRGITLDKAVEYIMKKAYEHGYIIEDSTDNIVLINVESKQLQIRQRIEASLEIIIQSEVQKYCNGITIEKGNTNNISGNQLQTLKEQASGLNISVAKLILINQIIVLDDNYLIDDLSQYSVRQLYLLLHNLDGTSNSGNDNSQGNGNPNN